MGWVSRSPHQLPDRAHPRGWAYKISLARVWRGKETDVLEIGPRATLWWRTKP